MDFKAKLVGRITIVLIVSLLLDSDPTIGQELDSTNHPDAIFESEDSATTANEIPIFPSSTRKNKFRGLVPHHKIYSRNGVGNEPIYTTTNVQTHPNHFEPQPDSLNSVLESTTISFRHQGQKRNLRLMKFLQHFRLDFSKFDSTCIKRGGRGIPAPTVPNAHIFKYTRRRNRALPRNRYAMALYECNEGTEFPPESADRMFCSRNKWVGPTPVCLPKGKIRDTDTECTKCDQICTVDEQDPELPVQCSCYAGYEMMDEKCVDVDECERGNGGCFGICFNKPGSYQCFCPTGFQIGPDGKNCIDRNECLLRNGHGPCQDTCENTLGSYTCSCENITGTKLATDKHSCEDVNECEEEDNFGCSHNCINTFGNAFCSCPTGLILSSKDYKTCISELTATTTTTTTTTTTPIPTTIDDEMEEDEKELVETEDVEVVENSKDKLLVPQNLLQTSSASDSSSSSSSDSSDSSKSESKSKEQEEPKPKSDNDETNEILNTEIECPPGSEPDQNNAQVCVEHEDCSRDNGGCEHICNLLGSYRFCTCQVGYELINETSCIDINECELENGGCSQSCVNIPGGHFCTCKKDYQLGDDKKSCKAKYCDELPPTSSNSEWECEHPDGFVLMPSDRGVVGTRCKLRCFPGFLPVVPTQTSRSHSNDHNPNYYKRLQYEIVNSDDDGILLGDEPGAGTGKIVAGVGIKCSSSGTWSPPGLVSSIASTTKCLSPSCSKLRKPEDGSLFPDICLQDNVPLNTQCLVLCSVGFYPKNGRIRTCSKGLRWFPEDNPLCLRISPTPRPYIHCPSDISLSLKPGQSSAYVKIPQPQANMDWYRYVEADPPWAKNLEWEVPAGVTQVEFTARSPVSNDTATCHFKIHVVDKEAPRVQGCPTSFEIRLSGGETSKEVWWSEPKFSDNVKLHYVQQSHSPGQILTRGTHHISYVAGDAEANKARCAFTITVHNPEDYEMSDFSYYSNNVGRHMVICPNLKTGRWTIHYAYYLPPGCRYHTQGLFSKLFKQNSAHQQQSSFPTSSITSPNSSVSLSNIPNSRQSRSRARRYYYHQPNS